MLRVRNNAPSRRTWPSAPEAWLRGDVGVAWVAGYPGLGPRLLSKPVWGGEGKCGLEGSLNLLAIGAPLWRVGDRGASE